MRWKKWVLSTSATLGASGIALAEEGFRAENCECLPPFVITFCPPKTPPAPGNPAGPVTPKEPVEPKQPGEPKVDPLARAPEAGTQAAESFNPNMYGDVFSGRRFALSYTTQTLRRISFPLSGTLGPIVYDTVNNKGIVSQLQPEPGSTIILTENGKTLSFLAPSAQLVHPVAAAALPQTLVLKEMPEVTAAVQMLNPGASASLAPGGNRGGIHTGEVPFYTLNEAYNLLTSHTTSDMVLVPGGGAVVGRTKIAEDNSPIPRDRIIFDVDAFNNTTLTPNGWDVTRFSPGFEATFADGYGSIEARFPFASTLDPNSTVGGLTSRATEFGDIHLTLKALLLRGTVFNVATGVGLDLPTGPDSVLQAPLGYNLLEIRNESYFVTPYVAALFTPDDRLFAQAWVQIGFDASGSSVLFNPAGTTPTNIGRLYDQTLLSTDVQLGYWVVRNPPGTFLRGFAPFAELHYNTPLSDTSAVSAPGLTLSPTSNRYDEVNLTLGFSALVAERLLLSAGFVTPLRGANDRSFDYQVGVRASWFFGAAPGGPGLPIAPTN